MPRLLCKTTISLGAALILCFAGSPAARAQTISISPSTGSYYVGQVFSVRINVSSPTQSVNAVSGTLSFPSNLLQVVSLSKTDSIMSLWVQEPSFSNSAGTIDFAGVILNPGFTGSAGKSLTVNFKAVNSGKAAVKFAEGSLLANDGNGTNILNTLGTADFTIGGSAPEASVPAVGDLVISSDTHPDPKKWYTASTAHFRFQYPAGATEIRLLVDKSTNSTPTQSYAPPIVDKTLPDLAEGIWYMHARYKAADGSSSAVANFRFNIDHTPPSNFSIQDSPDRDKALSKVPLTIFATDSVSYIDHYEFSIDSGEYVTWRDDGTSIYNTPDLFAGTHAINGRAVDAAGNTALTSLTFTIDGLNAPVITDYTKEISGVAPIFVKGRTMPNIMASLYVETATHSVAKVSDTKSGDDGSFTIAWQPSDTDITSGVLSPKGLHNMYVVGKTDTGHVTKPSVTLPLLVKSTVYNWLSQTLINWLVVLIILIALAYLILRLGLTTAKHFREYRREIRQEAKQAESVLHQSFKGMRDNLESYVELLEQASAERRLTDAEKKLVKDMKQNLDDAEKIIGKEIADVEEKTEKR